MRFVMVAHIKRQSLPIYSRSVIKQLPQIGSALTEPQPLIHIVHQSLSVTHILIHPDLIIHNLR